jgi:serine O-acetyltransferase
MLERFRSDVDRYVVLRQKHWLFLVITEQGLWALAEFRFSNWVYNQVHIPIVKQVLKIFSFFWHKLIQILTGIDIAVQADLGKGLYIGHFGGIFINSEVKLGENCNLSQGVTIGLGGRGDNRGCPKIGDRVFIGPGAKLFGAIMIGNDVAIGANAVVTKDLPDKAVAVGIPAKVISYESSKEYIIYRQ